MPQRLLTFALLSLAATTGARDASALGFGRAQPSATMGYPLDFSVAMRLESGEVLRPECVSAEVAIGDVPLSRTLVGASVESQAGVPSIRVRTNAPVDEPVVSVTVTAGCDAKVSRRFTLFADPPAVSMPAAPVVADVDALPLTALAAAREPAPTPETPARSAPVPAERAPAPPRAAAAERASENSGAARRAKPAKPAKTRVARKQSPAPVVAQASRLRLDAAPSMMATIAAASADAAASAAERETLLQAALQAAEQSASAAQASASAAAAQVAALQAGMDALKRDSQANREQIQRLSQALEASQSRGQWTPLLWAALAALLGAVGWLALKLRQARRETEAWWSAQPVTPAVAAAEAEPPTAASDAIALAQPDTQQFTEMPPAAAVAVAEDVPQTAVERTAPLPQGMLAPDPPTRDVSIEELLDLEQQAEFFIVLGQDDAAIDLLVGHLRSNGGTSPLPYLKLMDIYRRHGDEAAYERTRGRFNHRFNAVAPAWAMDQGAGRSLDAYPDVVQQLQRCWARPVDAMTALETLLFRTDARELFDLPAYREVLFLYSLSRDLLEQGDRNAARIDVLLPLAHDEDALSTTAARPYLNTDLGGPVGVDLVLDDSATAPVDLDLTDRHAARATSDFGFFEDKPSRVS